MSSPKSTGHGWVLLVVVCALLAASPLTAGESRWYLEGKLGQASVVQNFGPPVLGWRVDDEDTTASFEVGYTLHRYFDVQAGYHDLGTFTGQPRPCREGEICPLTLVIPQFAGVFPVEADFTGYSLSAVPRWPVTDRVSVFGKVGVLDWDGKLRQDVDGRLVGSPSDRELLAGIGARYTFPKGFGVLLEYEDSDLASSVSLGASWRF